MIDAQRPPRGRSAVNSGSMLGRCGVSIRGRRLVDPGRVQGRVGVHPGPVQGGYRVEVQVGSASV